MSWHYNRILISLSSLRDYQKEQFVRSGSSAIQVGSVRKGYYLFRPDHDSGIFKVHHLPFSKSSARYICNLLQHTILRIVRLHRFWHGDFRVHLSTQLDLCYIYTVPEICKGHFDNRINWAHWRCRIIPWPAFCCTKLAATALVLASVRWCYRIN